MGQNLVRLVRVARAVSLAGGAAAAAACGDVSVNTGPPPPPLANRVYQLQSVDGEPLPYVQYAPDGGDSTIVLNQSLSLLTGNRATRTTTLRLVQGGVAIITSQTAEYSYVTSGGAVVISPLCPPGALCVPGEEGSISDTELTLKQRNVPDAPVLRYTRVWPPD